MPEHLPRRHPNRLPKSGGKSWLVTPPAVLLPRIHHGDDLGLLSLAELGPTAANTSLVAGGGWTGACAWCPAQRTRVLGVTRVLEGLTGCMTALAVLPDGRVVSGSQDWAVILWDLETANAMSAFVGDAAITACVAARVDCLVVGSANGAVHILEVVAASV